MKTRKLNSIGLIVFSLVIFCPGWSFAGSKTKAKAEEKVAETSQAVIPDIKFIYPYDALTSYDPFVSLINERGQLTIQEIDTEKGLGSFKLQGIIYSGEGSQAVINNEIKKQGDMVGSFKIKSIDQEKVVMEKDNEEFILKLEGGI